MPNRTRRSCRDMRWRKFGAFCQLPVLKGKTGKFLRPKIFFHNMSLVERLSISQKGSNLLEACNTRNTLSPVCPPDIPAFSLHATPDQHGQDRKPVPCLPQTGTECCKRPRPVPVTSRLDDSPLLHSHAHGTLGILSDQSIALHDTSGGVTLPPVRAWRFQTGKGSGTIPNPENGTSSCPTLPDRIGMIERTP